MRREHVESKKPEVWGNQDVREALGRIYVRDARDHTERSQLQRLGNAILHVSHQALALTENFLSYMVGWQPQDKPTQNQLSGYEERNDFSEHEPDK